MRKESTSVNNKKVALSRWRNVSNKVNSHLLRISKTKKYKIEKARILGFLAGDGSVFTRTEKKRNVKRYEISFYPDHDSLIDPFVNAFFYLYLREPNIKKLKNHYSIRSSFKPACVDLLKTCEFSSLNWNIPLNFINTVLAKKEWLKAFFDCEAYVGKNIIQVQSVNQRGLKQVGKLLMEFDIQSRLYSYERKNRNWNTNYLLSIMKSGARQNFLTKIGFNHSVKHEKLRKQFASVPEWLTGSSRI